MGILEQVHNLHKLLGEQTDQIFPLIRAGDQQLLLEYNKELAILPSKLHYQMQLIKH